MNECANVTQADAFLAALLDAEQLPAPATTRAYESALRALDAWLADKPVTDTTLAEYLRHRHDTDGVSYATLEVIRAAVRFNAKLADVQSPDGSETALVLRRARRTAAARGRGQVAGVRWEQVDAAAAAAVASNRGSSAAGIRDAALLAVMSDAMLRVGEASALDWQDIVREADGSGRLIVRRSKMGQKGEDATLYLGPATMRRLDAWQKVSDARTGPLFQRLDRAGNPRGSLSERSVRTIIARRVADAGVEGRVSGHSLRVGSAQSLVRAGASMAELKQAGRWQSDRNPAHYTRDERARSGAVARFRYGIEKTES
ncbi:MAG: tyrosine-type recombinase/integrase [Rhodobacteraceae bacterium]|nr:tyrosine-type recombinase/integrase [Paracoccaceae bacterium]